MSKSYSDDLRRRVVVSVEDEGLSRRQAAARYDVGTSTVIRWIERFRETGSVSPGKIGGHKPKAIREAQRDWLIERPPQSGLHPAWTGGGTGWTRAEDGLSLGLGVRSR